MSSLIEQDCHDQAVINRIWAKAILEELTRAGVTEVCIAPGSRSTPLTLEADANSKLNLHTHYDERGLGFLALGMAKASSNPVAIIVTSGTAVANLLPSIAEANLTGEQLIVLTADRPVELVDCGANQAIRQQDIFSSHVTAKLDLPSPSLNVPLKWVLTSLDQLLAQQVRSNGAIHINCPYPEPLYSEGEHSLYQGYLDGVSAWWKSADLYSSKVIPELRHSIPIEGMHSAKGVIILGSLSLEHANRAKKLADKLGWVLLADPQSGVCFEWAHFDFWLQDDRCRTALNECELIVQFGSRVISKRLNQWLTEQVEVRRTVYHYVSASFERNNQAHLQQIHHVSDVGAWIDQANELIPSKIEVRLSWADALKERSQAISSLAEVLFNRSDLTEINLALSLNSLPAGAQLFLGNSLFVRLVDMFTQLDGVEVYSNRGASGIDGLIATAAGVIRATGKPTLIQIGDTSLLYDLNSLALLSREKTATVVLVTNNDGGAIFDLLPVPEQQKQSLYQMPHGYDFESAAAQFKLPYCKPESLAQYLRLVEQHLTQGSGALLVEVQTPPDQASSQLKEFIQHVHAL